MRSIYIIIFFVSFNLFGCIQFGDSKILPERGSSDYIGVRRSQYINITNKHKYNTKEESVNPLPANLPDITNERRIALIIGNADYFNMDKLSNPINDAKAMKRLLSELGFEVLEYENVNFKKMNKAIDEFGKRLKDYDVSLFFYAGHGMQIKGYNYLIPVDGIYETENDIQTSSIYAKKILDKMKCKTNIIILDACRNNKFGRSRGIEKIKGLVEMKAPSDFLIAYATSTGEIAIDGIAGTNGVYTSALLEHIPTANIRIEDMFKRVRIEVVENTNKMQTPWESTSLTETFFFEVQK